MRLHTITLAASVALAAAGAALAQATLPSDDVNSANNPGSVKNEAQRLAETEHCTCHTAAPEAVGTVTAFPSNVLSLADIPRSLRDGAQVTEAVNCTCRTDGPETTGTVSGTGSPTRPDATPPAAPGRNSAPLR